MLKKTYLFILLLILIGLFVPQKFIMPVYKATSSDYNNQTFWFYPWGSSGTHKGVDIFAKKGTELMSSTHGFVIAKGKISKGGNFVLVLGPKWRVHYYAHLETSSVALFDFLQPKSIIGTVGDTGNAKGKQPHVHYSIVTLIPYFWRIDTDPEGWKKMFYLNPITYLSQTD